MLGDFNLVLSDNDAVNRTNQRHELICRDFINRNLARLGLIDTYRKLHPSGGYTWKRGSCMSRLDMIFVTKCLTNKILSSKIDWAYDDSDHAMLASVFPAPLTLKAGPGLTRLDASVLEDKHTLDFVKNELKIQIDQIPIHWNPHTRLDFVKTAIRSIMATATGIKRKNENHDRLAICEQLNELVKVKERLEGENPNENNLLVEINRAIVELENENKKFLEEDAKKLILRAQVKWYEEGEKSNKYFLNLLKRRGQKKLITKLVNGNETLDNQTDIMSHITNFYSNLYNSKDTSENFDDLLSDLPKLDANDRRMLDREITLEELKSTLDECKESAPGPDGITYKVYQALWDQLGSFILDSWKYSLLIGILPYDQRLSAITLLPKQGKSPDKIENWRPITLSNCDLKITTKLLSNRVSKVLDKIIHPSQTAYIPGRVVHDNLRIFDFYNRYCKEHDIDALLISLDAKKAFDSVSHKYMHKVLEAYGFSNEFIDTVKMLYNDIKATVLVNGYKSTIIKILRSVKQGDALSCALFILCIDPLIRKIDSNPNIKPVPIPRSRFSNLSITNKISGFADDIGLAINNDQRSINSVFEDYSLFSRLSGIELNIDKTEVLKLNNDSAQLIYSLQMCEIAERELIEVDRMIFKFLWNRKWIGPAAPDRIKRNVLKQSYENGGLKAPDIKNLDRALKVKQFVRSMQSKHPINFIQKFQLERIGYDEYFKCEYAKICKYDVVVKTYQITCNLLTDSLRSKGNSLPMPDPSSIGDTINVIASTDILEYLMRKNELLLINRFGQLANQGVSTFLELVNESRFPRSDNIGNLAKYILRFFPPAWVEIVTMSNDVNGDITYEQEFPLQNLKLSNIKHLTVKTVRNSLTELEFIPTKPYLAFDKFELVTINHNINPFVNGRKYLHSTRDRFFKYRILQGDIFCNSRMFKFKMVNTKECPFCSYESETIKHLLWECPRSQEVWTFLNSISTLAYNRSYVTYESILIGDTNPISAIDTLIVQVLKLILTIDRSTSIDIQSVLVSKIKHHITIEKTVMKNKKDYFIKKWHKIIQALETIIQS